ncbi:hypothetical protein H1R20_g8916, partial [Candolleomyces eurysporus]
MKSPFTHHFNTNYVPSDNEIPAIRDAMYRGEEVLNDIDQKSYEIERRMEELRRELQALAERRETQKREVDELMALLSPIKRIDDDILTSIFLSVLDVVNCDHLNISKRHPAVVISHVCQRWRESALSTKLLWRHLHVRIPSYPYHSCSQDTWRAEIEKLVKMTEMWILRSNDCHLSVEINERRSPTLLSPQEGTFVAQCIEFNTLVALLCSSSPRWKDWHLKTDFPQEQCPNFPTMRLLAVPPQPTPVLTNAKLYFGVDEYQQESALSKHLVSGPNILSASTLRSLEIGGQVLTHDILDLPVAWANLERLVFNGYQGGSLYSFDAVQSLRLLKACPNLVTCELAFERDAAIPTGRAPILLPKLKELLLLPHKYHIPPHFATSFLLPSLRKLEVTRGYGQFMSRDHEASGLFELLERFGSTLQDVTFCYKPLTESALYHCLQQLPNITSLALFSDHRTEITTSLNNDILGHLSPKFDRAGTTITQLPLCPRIEVFRFRACSGDLDEEAFVDFIEARRREVNNQPLEGGRRIARLREVDCGYYDFRSIDPGAALRKRGFNMEAFSLTKWHYFPTR